MIPMETKAIFVPMTKYANKCAICHDSIPAGSPSYWMKPKTNYHKNCYEQSQASPSKNAAPMTEQPNRVYSTDRQAVQPGAATQEDPKAAVARMWKTSIALIKAEPQLAGIEDYKDYPLILAETLRALSYKERERFELEQQARNIKAFGKQ